MLLGAWFTCVLAWGTNNARVCNWDGVDREKNFELTIHDYFKNLT